MTPDIYFPDNAQFVDTFYPTIDGVVRTVDSYARIMNSSGAYSCVVAPAAVGKYTDNFPYDVARAKSLVLPLREYRLAVPELTEGLTGFLENRPFELFHAHSPFTMGRYALRLGRRLGIPVVATFHSKYYDDIIDVFHSQVLAETAVKDIVKFFESVDDVWSVSSGTARTLRDYGYNGDIFVIDNGTDYDYPDDPGAVAAAAKARFSLPDEGPVLMFAGHQVWQKNIRLVLDTAAELRSRGFEFTLLMVGSGYASGSIKSYAQELGLDESAVRFLGRVNDVELMKGLYLSSDLFFFPSVYDNAPLVLREASAMGTPSLLMRGSNAAEKIADGVNGFLIDDDPRTAADRIQAIFSAPGLLVRAGEEARRTICRPWDEILEHVSERYTELVRERMTVR